MQCRSPMVSTATLQREESYAHEGSKLRQQLREDSRALLEQPHHELPIFNASGSGLPSILEACADPVAGSAQLAAVAKQLATVGWVSLRLGASRVDLAEAVAEAMRAYPRMAPGKIVDQQTGEARGGVDPLGAPRGDRFAHVHDETALPGGAESFPALHALDATMEAVAVALGDAISKERGLPFNLTGRADGMIACFPGGGAEYGMHLDANIHKGYNSGKDPRKVTSILYLNRPWDADRDGGCLCMHDAKKSCWRVVPPTADSATLAGVKLSTTPCLRIPSKEWLCLRVARLQRWSSSAPIKCFIAWHPHTLGALRSPYFFWVSTRTVRSPHEKRKTLREHTGPTCNHPLGGSENGTV